MGLHGRVSSHLMLLWELSKTVVSAGHRQCLNPDSGEMYEPVSPRCISTTMKEESDLKEQKRARERKPLIFSHHDEMNK